MLVPIRLAAAVALTAAGQSYADPEFLLDVETNYRENSHCNVEESLAGLEPTEAHWGLALAVDRFQVLVVMLVV